MGTFVTITVSGGTEKQARQAIDMGFREIGRLEKMMSHYRPDSNISQLNQQGYLTITHPELREVIARSLYYGHISDGAFDITVKPVLDLYRECYQQQHRPPSTSELSKAMSLVDYRNLIIADDRVYFTKRGVQITLDGIAKGYIVDQAVEVLQKNGIRYALINAGGDMRSIGQRLGTDAWSIALQNPRNTDDYLAVISLDNLAVATSGDYEQYFVPDKTAHHIIDPKTGQSASSLISTTVVAKTAADADALSTTVFVLGAKKGMALIEQLEEVEALLITKERDLLLSSGFAKVLLNFEQSQLRNSYKK